MTRALLLAIPALAACRPSFEGSWMLELTLAETDEEAYQDAVGYAQTVRADVYRTAGGKHAVDLDPILLVGAADDDVLAVTWAFGREYPVYACAVAHEVYSYEMRATAEGARLVGRLDVAYELAREGCSGQEDYRDARTFGYALDGPRLVPDDARHLDGGPWSATLPYAGDTGWAGGDTGADVER